MQTLTQPKVFISYAHADGQSKVREFWTNLREFLKTPERQWDKWSDHEVSVGQEWDKTIVQALKQGCNCSLLLISDLFAKSSYIMDKEWPQTLARNEEQGILFFPVVFGVLDGGLAALPEGMDRFQVYWPTVADLYIPPPENVQYPDQVRQCYKQAKDKDSTRELFLSRLARQMNTRFDEYLREQALAALPTTSASTLANVGQFVTNSTDEEIFAKAIFGSFSYEKRYRDSNSKGHYFRREIDARLDERLSRNEWVLVEGHPLAGKTRAVFEAIKRLMVRRGSVAVWPFKVPERTDQPLIPPDFPEADCRIVWMDDIDARFRDMAKRGYGTNEINRFLGRLADEGLILAATSRTGPTYYDFRHRFGLDDHLWDKLESLPINRLEGEEEKEFTEWYVVSFNAILPDKFDHHPGSLFLNLETMGDRWRNMDKIADDHKLRLDVERAKEIMRALHVFYVMEAYLPGGQFLEDHIRFYLRHKAERRRATTSMGVAFARVELFNQLPGGDEWEGLIEFLSQDKFHLGFLRREGNFLLTETAYLDYIVAQDGERNIAQTIVDDFSEEERLRLGLIVTSYNFGDVFRGRPLKTEQDLQRLARKLKDLGLERDITVWNQLVKLCPTFSLARYALVLLGNVGIRPDVLTYRLIIAKANAHDDIRTMVDEMEDAIIAPNVFTYSTLVAAAKDYDTARGLVEQMKRAEITPNAVTYNMLVAVSKEYDTARAVVDEMKAAGLIPDVVTYTTLVGKAKDPKTARVIIQEMRAVGIVPNIYTYNTLVAAATDYDTAWNIVKEMRAAGIMPDVVTYNTLVVAAKDYDTARTIVKEMRAAGIVPNLYTYSTLVSKAKDYDTVREVVSEMKVGGITPNVNTYNTLVGKAKDPKTARVVIGEMRAAGIMPNVITYNILVAATKDYETARAVVDEMKVTGVDPTTARTIIAEMKAAGIAPNVTTYNTLLSKVTDYSTARTVVAEMIAAGIATNVTTYKKLLGKAKDYDTVREVVNEMKVAGIATNVTTYNMLISGATDYSTASALVAEMKAAGISPTRTTYNNMLAKSPDYTTARALIAEMEATGMPPIRTTYNNLITKSPDYTTARAIVAEMEAAGISPSIGSYSALAAVAPDYATARAVIAEMEAAGISPSIRSYSALAAAAPDYDTARAVIAEMEAFGVRSNVRIVSTLFAKDLSLVEPNDLLNWYLQQQYQFEIPLEVAIKSYCEAGQVNSALAIALHYPALDASRRLMRENPESALNFFSSIVELDPGEGNGNYALGITLIELNRGSEAIPHLEKALTQARALDQASTRVSHIEQLLLRIVEGTSG
ncbi:MAG TPA: TIR domain-containing protein [Pyrinomonadaceae bacterium]|nr:TIR domain-containing protein [Pyrinomonadaceae bacterium]